MRLLAPPFASTVSVPAASQTKETETPGAAGKASNSDRSGHEDLVEKSSTASEASPGAKTAAVERPLSPNPVPATGSLPGSAAPPRQESAQPRGDARPAAAHPELDPFWNQKFLTKSWDLDRLTTQDEISLGNELHSLILELNPTDNGSGLRRVKEAAKPLLELRSRKDLQYEFTILNSDIPNAFSHPGGFIYISRKLLEMIAEDEDYVLEFVIGHEIAHVELQHALHCLQDRRVREFKDGTLQKLYFLIIPHAYPNELEFAADAWVYRRMKQLGRSEHDCFAFLRKLDSYAKANGFDDGRGKVEDLFKDGRGKPDATPARSPIENHLRAHTAAWSAWII